MFWRRVDASDAKPVNSALTICPKINYTEVFDLVQYTVHQTSISGSSSCQKNRPRNPNLSHDAYQPNRELCVLSIVQVLFQSVLTFSCLRNILFHLWPPPRQCAVDSRKVCAWPFHLSELSFEPNFQAFHFRKLSTYTRTSVFLHPLLFFCSTYCPVPWPLSEKPHEISTVYPSVCCESKVQSITGLMPDISIQGQPPVLHEAQ